MDIPKKQWLSKVNYKLMSKGAPWKSPRKIPHGHPIAVDVDSLVFMYMRQGWGAKRCAKSLAIICNTNKNYILVYSTGVPILKKDLYLERNILDTPYNNRDHIRDKAVRYLLTRYLDATGCPRMVGTREADKYCGKRYKYIITEDVDVFLFGNSKTTIIHPLTYNMLRCKDYYMVHGISTHGNFLDVAIAIGTDYNYGIKGLGIKTIHKIIVTNGYKNITEYLCATYDITSPSNKWYSDNYFKVLLYFTGSVSM
ncbi:hypothetical protein K457DRAFT_418833 [Linnemannia elongata AG-77]|uniref:PIN domain-like protein n=1 Tax=Linnemannia elongata AG-77 TaxID=1314771 RepID=A0A197JC86_9FUNG|nr:hypothetical protein K457DRAFT_418833 [Linnemannia elongata AG-77]